MAIRTRAGLVLAALLTTACDDLSQKKPETGSTTANPTPTLSAPARRTAGGTVQTLVGARAHAGPEDAAGGRSIRLFGRGISRQRQTRV